GRESGARGRGRAHGRTRTAGAAGRGSPLCRLVARTGGAVAGPSRGTVRGTGRRPWPAATTAVARPRTTHRARCDEAASPRSRRSLGVAGAAARHVGTAARRRLAGGHARPA